MAFDAQSLIDFVMQPWLGKPLWMWLSFTGLVLFLLALDLGVLNRKNRVISVRHSLILSVFYISLGLLYGAGIWFTLGAESGMNYLTGFAVEKALAIDNIFMALVLIEIADVVFAVDSVPAIFAITTDPFIVYTSNIFAILGLRALYFALSAMIERFHYLKYALAIVLIVIGGKIFAADLLGIEKIPPALSLAMIVSIIGAGVVVSLIWSRPEAKKAAH